MTIIAQPAIIDSNGNLNVHGKSGLSLVLSFTDAVGANLNVAANDIVFDCGPLSIALGAGAQNWQRTLTLDESQVASLGLGAKSFALIDRTGAAHNVLWSGSLRVFGYV